MSQNLDRARYDFKRDLEELRDIHGRGTELISLYVPHSKQVFDAISYLRNEYSQSSNIKSKGTKKNVMAAIESIMSRLKNYKQAPENGVVFFVGHVPTSGDQTAMRAYVIEPPEAIFTFIYRCDNRFHLDLLEDMLVDKKSYGLIVIDRNEATIGLLKGKRIVLIKNMQSRVMGKHRQGGQSSVRFERLIEISVQNFFQNVSDLSSDAFMAEEDLQGVIIGGPGNTKRFFHEKEAMNHELRKKTLDLVDTCYTDESGLRELVQNAETLLSDLDLVKEKRVMQRFLREVRKPDGGLGTYGEEEVLSALEMGSVEILLISEAMRKYHMSMKCGACGKELKTVSKDKSLNVSCPDCNNSMNLEESKDIVDSYYETAEQSNTKITLISGDTEEGDMLLRAFGGVAALLRYKVN